MFADDAFTQGPTTATALRSVARRAEIADEVSVVETTAGSRPRTYGIAIAVAVVVRGGEPQ